MSKPPDNQREAMAPTWIEVALNGPWGQADQPGVPLDVDDCIEEGIACVRAGAAIVHLHAFDPTTDEQTDDPGAYAEIIDGITSEVDAIVYPTILLAGESSTGVMPGEERFAHQATLAAKTASNGRSSTPAA